MIIKTPIHYTLLYITLLVFVACNEHDSYSTSPRHILTFSQDTLQLDTIFTGISTSTHLLKVYNRNKQALSVSSIELADARNSGFRINVDGLKGSNFANVEIPGKDSLYIFVEATPERHNQDAPFLIKDSIIFVTNGVVQDIKLLAFGQNATVLKGKVIEQDTTFTAQSPILVYDSICVAPHATLTLEAGTRLFFHAGAGMKVHGRLDANGNIARPIVFRGDRTDNLFTDLPYDRLPGQWEGVRFSKSSYGNTLNYVDIHGGNFGVQCDSSLLDQTKLLMTNSKISQVTTNAVAMVHSKATFANTEISNAGNNCVMLLGGDYEFVHCTLANYYSWGTRKGAALAFSNEKDGTKYALMNASFRNCIVAGSSDDEVLGSKSDNEEIPFNNFFSHCLVNSTEESGEGIENVVWAKDDHFILNDREKQLYNFGLDAQSAAIDIGSQSIALSYPTDRLGVSRVSDEAPDAGCYEWAGE